VNVRKFNGKSESVIGQIIHTNQSQISKQQCRACPSHSKKPVTDYVIINTVSANCGHKLCN